MEEYQSLIQIVALTMGAAWASGINLYATVAVLGLAGSSGYIDLPATLEVVQDPMVILAAGFMYQAIQKYASWLKEGSHRCARSPEDGSNLVLMVGYSRQGR